MLNFNIKVLNVRLPVDERNRSKGFGYVEFADRESLIAALTKRDTTFNNRPIKITVDEPKQDGGYRNRTGDRGGDRGGNQQDGPLKSDEADWRRPQPDSSQGDSEANWSSGGGGGGRDQQQRYNQNRDNRYGNRQDNQRGGGGGYQRRGGNNWSGNRGGQEFNEGQRRQYTSIALSFF